MMGSSENNESIHHSILSSIAPFFPKTFHHQKKRSKKIERRGRKQGEWEQTKEKKRKKKGTEKRNSESIKSKNEQLLPAHHQARHCTCSLITKRP
jgi:hypothetical protein